MIPRGYQPIPFPSYRYHPTEPKRLVHSIEEALALGPGWRERRYAPGESPAHPAPGEPAFVADADVASPEAPALDPQAEELHKTRADDVVTTVKASSNIAALEKARAMEVAHPVHQGGRRRVLAAIDARLALLRGEA